MAQQHAGGVQMLTMRCLNPVVLLLDALELQHHDIPGVLLQPFLVSAASGHHACPKTTATAAVTLPQDLFASAGMALE